MNFIKKHWFNILIVLFIILSMGLSLIVAFAPKEDKLERGFIPCTKQLTERIIGCHSSFWCVTSAIFKNSACDAKVIGQGLKLWVSGKQSTPWSNYYFTPDLSHLDNTLEENAELFYEENPNFMEDFEKLKEDYKKLVETNENDEKNKDNNEIQNLEHPKKQEQK